MLRITYKSVLLAGSVLAATSVPALAQDSADIVVTARRVEERLQDVPLSIQVFNQEQLSNKNISNAVDLATYTPSLTQNTTFGPENARFQIRGFVQEADSAPSVGIYFADAVVPRGAGNAVNSGNGAAPGMFFDLQNVQVLKGPQGTLFGRNTTGGAILLVPQKPTDKLEGFVEGSIGNYDMRRIAAVINVPLAETFKVRLGVERQKRDGWLRNYSGIGPDAVNDIDYVAVRGSVVADLTPDLENYTVVTYAKSDTNATAQRIIACDANATPPRPPLSATTTRAFSLGCLGEIRRRDAAAAAAGRPNDPYGVMVPYADAHSTVTTWQVINTTTWQASDNLTVKNIANYAELKQSILQDFFGIDFLSTDINPALLPVHFGFASIQGLKRRLTNQMTFTEELQLQGRALDGKLNWVAGGYFEMSKPLGAAGNAPPILINCTDYQSNNCTDPLSTAVLGGAFPIGSKSEQEYYIRYYNHALFAQATYDFSDQFKITGGFRYTWDVQKNRTIYFNNTFLPLPAYGLRSRTCNPTPLYTVANGCTANLENRSDAPTWLIDVVYKPTPDIMLYGKYGRGYRAGTIVAGAPAPLLTQVRPEKVDFFEAGVKSSFDGVVRGTFNVSAFYNKFSDQQIQFSYTPLRQGIPRSAGPINAGKSRIWGIEVDSNLSPFEGFNLQASYTYLNTRITQAPDVPALLAASGFSTTDYLVATDFQVGDPLVFAPKHKLSLTASYTLPLDESVGKITFSGTYLYTSSMVSNYKDRLSSVAAFRGLGTLPEYSLVNLNLNWNNVAGAPVDLSLFVTNLTKKYYYTFTPGNAQASPLETAALGEPRMFGMRLKYRFGD